MPRSPKSKTPRPYLSWSQLSLFETNPEQYRRRYILEEEEYKNDAMNLGSKVARLLETGEDDSDPALMHLSIYLPRYDQVEFEITAEVGGVPLLGRLDGFRVNPLTVGEYKTGRKWTQSMADDLGQITFYDLLVWNAYNKIPENRLHWAETERRDGDLYLTGKITTFETKRTVKDLALMTQRIKKAWKGIKAMCQEQYDATN